MRRLVCHKRVTIDREELLIYTLYEEGIGKEQVKRDNPYTKTQELLINRGSFYEYIRKKHKRTHYPYYTN